MTAIKNTITRSVAPKSVFEDASALIPSTLTCDQGDFLILDTTAHTIIKPTLEADCVTFLGIANDKLVLGKPASPYQGTSVDAAQAAPALRGPVYGVIAKCVAKTGDTFNPGVAVYFDPATGARGVTSTAGTKSVGTYQGKAVTAVAGQEIEVLIAARYPGDVAHL